MKIVILYECNPDDWTYQEWKKNNINTKIIFKKVNKILRGIRRYWFKYNIPVCNLWYAGWKKAIINSDMIIVHASYLTMNLPLYINKLNPNARVIMWYWNAIDKATIPSIIKGKCELWSFDPENCRDYKMSFNHQYYFKSLIMKSDEIKNDVFFCGEDAGRGKAITDMYDICKKQGVNAKIQIVKPKYEYLPKEIISDRVDYFEICKSISESRSVLELTKSKQSGVTLRAMEALFFGKKLITDNHNIKNEEFYSKNNCFIIGEDPIERLKDFLYNVPFVPYDQSLLDKYDVKQWLKNFKKLI